MILFSIGMIIGACCGFLFCAMAMQAKVEEHYKKWRNLETDSKTDNR